MKGFFEVSLGFLQGSVLGFQFSRLSVFVPCLPTVFLAFGFWLSASEWVRSLLQSHRNSVFAFGFHALNPTLPGTPDQFAYDYMLCPVDSGVYYQRRALTGAIGSRAKHVFFPPAWCKAESKEGMTEGQHEGRPGINSGIIWDDS